MWRYTFSRVHLAFVLLTWIVMVGLGALQITAYESSAGASSDPPRRWPRESRLAHAPGRPTVTMFVHPKCPCSRGSVEELAQLIHRNPDGAQYNVAFFNPEGESEEWSRTDLYRAVAALPQVRIYTDREGEEARRFKVRTSGTAVMYDRNGRLQFHGGVTLSRNHPGDNPGRQFIQSLLSDGKPPRSQTPVFGCPISTPSRLDKDGGAS